MQIQSELKPMFSYSLIPIIIIIVFIIILIITIRSLKKKDIQKQLVIPTHKDVLSIKKKYLIKIKQLENDITTNKITNRKAYQALSKIIRNFIYETTNIKVQNYTLNEIKSINMPILYDLVNEYYTPEFARQSGGNIAASINKTKVVIERWN